MGQSSSLMGDNNFLMGLAAGATAVAAAGYLHGATHGCPALGGDKRVKSGLLEYSVVYTDRSYNLMSSPFQQVMRDISSMLNSVYNAEATVLIPGSGTYGMEACARQFGSGKKCMILRNGYFSFRWSDIFEVTGIAGEEIVLKGRAVEEGANPHFATLPIEEVVAQIKEHKPDVFFAPHVETSTGIILTDDYVKQIADAVHSVGGLFVLDGIASGCIWVDMKKLDIDAFISAPQKGWSGPACVGIVMLGARGKAAVESAPNAGGSFCCNLQKWHTVMQKYVGGAFMYYTTLPTDALTKFRDVMLETQRFGFGNCKLAQEDLGHKIRKVLEARGFKSVAGPSCQAPGVVVSYASDKAMVGNFKKEGIQIAGGVPFKIGEPEGLITFRLGLFGLDKLKNVDRTVKIMAAALDSASLKGTGV